MTTVLIASIAFIEEDFEMAPHEISVLIFQWYWLPYDTYDLQNRQKETLGTFAFYIREKSETNEKFTLRK